VGETIKLEIHQGRTAILINGIGIKTSPKEHLILLFLASRAKEGKPAFVTYKEAVDELNRFRRDIGRAVNPNDLADWRRQPSVQSDLDEEALRKNLSSLRGKIQSTSEETAPLVACLPEHGRFSLDIPGPMIFIK
jgi:hypothetical protein